MRPFFNFFLTTRLIYESCNDLIFNFTNNSADVTFKIVDCHILPKQEIVIRVELRLFVKVSSKWKVIHEISLGLKSAENLKLRRISLSVSEKYILYGAYKLFIFLRQFLSRLSQITIGSKLISFLTSVLVHRKFTSLMGKKLKNAKTV